MQKIHLDTDLGGDIDDISALAMALRWPDVEITGITTVGGRRAGYVRYALGLEGRSSVPVAAGADVSQGFYRYRLGFPLEERYWPEQVAPSPNVTEEALDLLRNSIRQGAAIVAIGPNTNLYLLEMQSPGTLMQANLFLMGGYIHPVPHLASRQSGCNSREYPIGAYLACYRPNWRPIVYVPFGR